MGAGGGGVVGMIVSSQEHIGEINQRLSQIGWSNIPWKMDKGGVIREEINL